MIYIVCNSSDEFAQHCGVTLVSLFETNKDEKFTVYILTAGFSSDNERKMRTLFVKYNQELILLKPDMRPLEGLPILNKSFSLSVYLRILTARLLPNTIEKVLYLDCDIVVNGTIAELWNLDISNFSMAAVEDIPPCCSEHCRRLGYSTGDLYINSGVMLINMKYWRDHDVANRALYFVRNNPDKILIYDQDALNAVLHGTIYILPIKWNMVSSYYLVKPQIQAKYLEQLDYARKKPKLIHYLYTKPWYKDCTHPFKGLYYKYLSKTEWSDYAPPMYSRQPFCLFRIKEYAKKILDIMHIRKNIMAYVKIDR